MSLELVHYATVMHETASEAFLFCKDHLEKRGHLAAVSRLEGLDSTHTDILAFITLQAMRDIRPLVANDGEALDYVELAISSLRRALQQNHQQAA